MKAIGFNKTGSVDVLTLLELPQPVLAPGEILVRVAAAGVNPSDSLFRSGGLPFVRLKFPFVPGLDIAGMVTAVAPDVTQFRVGDAVYGMLPNTRMGGYAEYAAIAAAAAAPIPDTVPFTVAAAVPTAALTALQALRDLAQLSAGQRVLINGAAGGVGSFAVQIARAMGAQVTAVTSTRNLDLARSLGAENVIDYTQEPLAAAGGDFDVVFDAVGVRSFTEMKPVLRRNGVGLTVNPIRGHPLAQLQARLNGRRWRAFFTKPNGADLKQLNLWLASGIVQPLLDTAYALANAAAAQQYSESKRVRGKLVLRVDAALAAQTPAGAAPTVTSI